MKRCIRANRGEENPVWKSHRFLFLPLPKLWNLGAQPCQPGGGGITATRHLQPSGRGRGEVEGWTNSHSRAAWGGGHWQRQRRHTLCPTGSQPAPLPAGRQQETNTPWPGSASSATSSRSATSCLKQETEGSFRAATVSPLFFLAHTSLFLTPPSLRPPSSLVIPPSVSLHHWGFFAFPALGRRRTETEGGGANGE